MTQRTSEPVRLQPIISVAIATRNYSRYLPRALASALRAGRALGLAFEIVVVDDASTDETREVLERFRLAYPDRIRAIYRSTSRGVAVAKNTALGHCAGRYIALLDADDEFHPEKLARCYARLAGGAADLVTHDCIYLWGPAILQVMTRTTWHMGLHYDFWAPSTWVFPNSAVRFNDQMFGGAEDLEWLARHRGALRRDHVEFPVATIHLHPNGTGDRRDSMTPCEQVLGRMRGGGHAIDRRAPRIWACASCGRQSLLPATCCGRPAAPAPLLFYSIAQSPARSPSPPEFSFLFLTRNQVHLTRRAVESLLASLGDTSAELIFVDGGSTDDTLEAVRSWAASLPVKWVSVLPEEPFNYSRNANRGARAATGTYLILVNNDVELCSAGLADALRAALADPRVGVAGVSTAWNEAQCDPDWDTRRFPYVFTRRPLAGHCWGTRREVYWELGGLDESFTGYGYEELDFAYRAVRGHYRLALAAGRVAHEGAATFRAEHGATGMRALEQVNRGVFERKHGCAIYADGNRIEPFAGWDPAAVSVVMVARDAGEALRRTLEGAVGEARCQDGSVQLVVVNNGSEDETRLVLAEYRRRLPRLLTVLELEQPLPPHQAIALGRARTIGQVLLTCEPGDPLP